LTEELNKLGERGWEAIAMTGDGHVLLKRQKAESDKHDHSTPGMRSGNVHQNS
jgi:hypothetical protein